jgi:uncharacterized protein with PIN domain
LKTRFVADAMLGSLARKLRIFGYDTVYFSKGDDPDLESLASQEGRVILTSDKGLYAHAVHRSTVAVLVEGASDRARMRSVREQLGDRLSPSSVEASRCAACNGELRRVTREEIAARVPERVAARHRIFWVCAACGKPYWRGSHWRRLRRLSYSMRTKGSS